MKPPHGMTIRNVSTADDLARNEYRISVEVESVIHFAPPPGQGMTPCCDRTPFELPVWDRLTTDPEAVTCLAHLSGSQASATDGGEG